jgi:microcystin-dependent protein
MDPLMTTIILFAGNFAPRGFAFCEGQLINIAENTAVFSLLGTTHGGNGTTTFALPDLREAEKSLDGARYIFALEGIYPTRP